MSELSDRWRAVRDRIRAACEAQGRDPDSVRLLAVSKRHPAEAIRALYAEGQRDFGENYAQELEAKAEALADLPELRWHFIGGYQRNKAHKLAAHCSHVHTLSSAKGADALSRHAETLGRQIEVLLQVNVGHESQKSGCEEAAVPALVEALHAMPALRLRGLMCIPPAGDLQLAADCYRRLASLASQQSLTELSMGMSADLETAVACGATWVRIGTDIFGARPD